MALKEARRSGEIICFFPVRFPAIKGDAYLYLFMDIFSLQFIHTGIERSSDIEQVLKHMRILMQHEDFKKINHSTFTLVVHNYLHHQTEIETIIKPYRGILHVDEKYLLNRMMPAIELLFQM